MQRLKIAAFSIAFLSLVCQSGCKSGDSDSQKSNGTSIQDVTEAGEEKSTGTTAVDDPDKKNFRLGRHEYRQFNKNSRSRQR